MLHKTHAVHALQQGCSRLGLPASTAAALVQFLALKRTHDQFVPDQDRQLRMSPGAGLDKLWHYMLLNTSVSSLVHEQLGGVVEHRGSDAWELPDDTKLLQRLYALNIMRLEGHQPDVTLWTEAGTAMHTLHLTASPVAALQSLPGGGRLYVTPSLTQQQQGRLVAALQALYAQDVQQPPAGAAAGPTAAAAVVVRAAADGAEPAAKRACFEQPRQQQQQQAQQQQQQQQRAPSANAAVLHIRVMDQLGTEVHFAVKPHNPLRKVFSAYVEHKGIDIDSVYFKLDCMRIRPDDTPWGLSMEDGDVIDCFLQQVGC